MNFRTIKNGIRNQIKDLNKSYEPIHQKPLMQIAELTLVLPALGMYYVWEYFNNYHIEYYLYFDLKDGLSILYQNLMPIIFTGTMLSLVLAIFVPDIIRKKNGSNETAHVVSQPTVNEQQQKGVSNFTVLCMVLIALVGFYVLLRAYEFDILTIIVFLVVVVLVSWLYLFIHKNIGFGATIILAFIFTMAVADKNAKYNKETKPRLNIVLKNHSETPVLTENDKCKYLIYKTSNYYFIQDDCKKMIYSYSISTGEMTSFSIK
jgi:hypothetical protein